MSCPGSKPIGHHPQLIHFRIHGCLGCPDWAKSPLAFATLFGSTWFRLPQMQLRHPLPFSSWAFASRSAALWQQPAHDGVVERTLNFGFLLPLDLDWSDLIRKSSECRLWIGTSKVSLEHV